MTLIRLNEGYVPMRGRYHWNNMDRFVNTVFNQSAEEQQVDFVPPVNILEGEKSFTIQMAIPGIRKEDLSIQIENGILKISNENQTEHEESSMRLIRQEIRSGRFNRHFRLSRWVDQEKINAQLTDGILVIEILKKEEAIAKPARQIEIA